MAEKKQLRDRVIKVRLNEQEFQALLALEKELGINRTDLIRKRLFHNTNAVFINAKELLRLLHLLGGEIGRVGNNINQLAKHANVMSKMGVLSDEIIKDFEELFGNYIKLQGELDRLLRQLLRVLNTR
ncbi:plasmid mobilization relaxosome protein MobC [Pedobacter sp. SYSU D00535]|uniref:plasmid mobilization protein n=1 Tax=Pedobacter sp. SYSU D00535 TaxID=2810308 RepID=UPI001A96F46F|nr:plasmid mobilization relaxosome protein MobC [Pedobacter sp. SYSU D00535]